MTDVNEGNNPPQPEPPHDPTQLIQYPAVRTPAQPSKRKWWPWIALAAVSLAVFGSVTAVNAITGNGKPESAASPKAKPVALLPTSPSANSRQESEAAFVRSIAPFWPGVADAKLLELGSTVCDTLERTGGNAGAIADAVPATDRTQTVDLMTISSEWLCPDMNSSVLSWKAADDAKPTTPAPPPAPAKPTIEEGTWTVGEDFPAGTYRTQEVADETCYWGIYKSGTNGSKIIDNHLGGGKLRVTLKKGQDFESTRCGTWEKVK